jgi:hypothetical protein
MKSDKPKNQEEKWDHALEKLLNDFWMDERGEADGGEYPLMTKLLPFIHKARQEAIAETKAEQNRIVNSGRKLFQEGQKDERKRLIEDLETWVKANGGILYRKKKLLLSYLQSLKK